MNNKDQKETKVFICGCKIEDSGVQTIEHKSKYHVYTKKIRVWVLTSHCDEHKPNYTKKSDNFLKAKESMAKREKIKEMELKKKTKYRRLKKKK